MVFSVILAIIIGIGHYLSDKFCLACSAYKKEIISIVAGVSLSYFLLQLLPEIYTSTLSKIPFLFVLIGFTLFHLVEKYIYQEIPKNKITQDLLFSHSIALFIYYVLVGLVLYRLSSISYEQGFLFFIPVFLHATLSTLSAHGIHGLHNTHYKFDKFVNLLQTIGSLLGVAIASLFIIPENILLNLTGFVVGVLLFIIVRDTIPKEKEGSPFYFILGIVFYLIIIISLGLLP